MGFFKKLFKGVKKVFKKIGSGIKKAVGKIGKFMGKLGIVGQIGLGLLLPGIGSMMGTMFGNLATSMMGSTFGIVRGAGHVINAAVNIGTGAGRLFSSITEGVTTTIGEITGTVLNKMGISKVGSVSLADKDFSNLWKRTQEAFSGAAEAGKDLFSMDTLTAENVFTQKATEAAAEATISGTAAQEAVSSAVDYSTFDPATGGTFVDSTVQAPAVDYSTFDPATGGTFVDSTAQAVAVQQPSLLDKVGSTIASRTKEAVTKIPGQFSQAAIANLTAIPREAIVAGIQGPARVSYDVRQSSIPDIGFAGIGQESAQPSFDPVSYFDQNQVAFNQRPFGFGAAMYGEANYFRNMQSYGFQVPMYGMS
jgi:hypothetical protein